MSNSFVAGQRLTAQRMPWQRQWSVSSTTASSGFTALAALLTSPSSTYLANSAYALHWSGLGFAGTANTALGMEVRDTNTVGTARVGTKRFHLVSIGTNYAVSDWAYVANTTASDITSRVLALCGSAAASTTINAGANLPFFFVCYYVGVSSDYPEAFAL